MFEMNGVETKFLFQESLKKELIESFNKVEGPILESKEDFDKILILQLARISNKEWMKNDSIKINTSMKAINDMNILFLNNYPLEIKKYANNLLKFNQSFFSENEIKTINTFDALLFGLGSMHGLAKDDRRFYYDPIYSEFIPIYYDGMSKILSVMGYDYKKDRFLNKKINDKFLAIEKLHTDYRNDVNRSLQIYHSKPFPDKFCKN